MRHSHAHPARRGARGAADEGEGMNGLALTRRQFLSGGGVTVFTGKGELGQGIRTALQQVAAEQLAVPFASITMITADTQRTPNEGYTSGSNSMKDSGTAILNAAAQVRELLVAEASRRIGVAADQLVARDGAVHAPGGKRVGYGELVAGPALHVRAEAQSKFKD